MRSDTRTSGEPAPESPGGARAFLVVYAHGQVHVTDLPAEGTLVVGRDAASDLVLDDDRASRRHAEVSFDGVTLTIRDLDSRNGTTLNGRRISKPTRLVTGDEIGIGRARLVAGLTAEATRAGRRLLAWSELEAHLAVAVRAVRHGEEVAGLALVAARGDEGPGAILEALPEGMLAGSWGAEKVGVLVRAASAPSAADTVARLLQRAGANGAAGLALAPGDGVDVERIVEAARLALAAAAPGRVGSPPREPRSGPDAIVAIDPSTRAARDLAERVAPHDTSVLLVGETGSGKEVLAREIHRLSRRAKGPFVAVNCGAIPTTLVEATLFGHERGSFTGATERRDGMFHAADEGTMLLDEVGELSPSAQAAMLRVLERGEVTRVGSTRAEPVNVRVLAATNRDLEDAVARGGFRRDLLFRLDRFSILVPPLRDRPDDLAALVRRTLGERAISEPAKKALATYGWPGNVRELQNVLERAIVLAGQGPVDVDHLPRRLVAPTGSSGSLRIRLEGTEAEAIKDALEATGGNRTHAARRLGISRRALLYKMQKLKLR